jgi:peptidoglycan-associated lipoprotein
MRTLSSGLVLAALAAAPAAAQAPAGAQPTPSTQNTTTETRPALPTVNGDTGIWFLPTGNVLPANRWSFSLFRSAFDARQGLTDVGDFGVTAAYGIGDQVEVFANWKIVRISRNLRNPTFVPSDPNFGGIAQEVPYVRHSWSKNVGGPLQVGAKWAVISQSRGDALSLAPRVILQFPSGNEWSTHNEYLGRAELVGSREFGAVEVTGMAGAVLRGDSEDFRVSDGVAWGVGAMFPSRSRLRGMFEWTGEYVIDQYAEVINGPFIADDGSFAPTLSRLRDPAYLKFGGVFQTSGGWFVHAGANYSQGIGDRMVAGRLVRQNEWALEANIGWHPGTKVYVPPPPPEPVVREVIREVPAPAAPAPNRNPTFSVNAVCTPGVVEPGQTSNCTATATDPDGDPVTYQWTAPQGTFSAANAQNTVWTAPGQVGNVPITVTARDNRGGTATSTVTVQVVRRQTLMFEDVHFDFDRFNLRPDALQILDAATATLMMNPDVRITIEGHCDSIGTIEYNLALGERRANSVRDYLVNRGIMTGRLRTVSYGEERPKADNNTAAGRAENRRAALVVIIEQQ